jgi:RNA polymerase sigma-70 factor, ECF subfamily
MNDPASGNTQPLRVLKSDPGGTLPGVSAPRPPDELIGALVERSRAGSMDAWGRLYTIHFDALYRHLCYLTGDAAESEDLVQEVFARALTFLARFEGRSTFSTWLHGIAINVARKHRDAGRKSERTQRRMGQVANAIPLGDELERQHVQRARAAALYEILDRLPAQLRDAFVLRDLQGLSVPEAAAQLRVSEGNLRVRACRARARIHDELVASGWIEPAGGS